MKDFKAVLKFDSAAVGRANALPCPTLDTPLCEDLIQELIDLKSIHAANFGDSALAPFELLKKLHECKLQPLFYNCTIALRIFCTIPATVAEAERSFSKLKLIKNFL